MKNFKAPTAPPTATTLSVAVSHAMTLGIFGALHVSFASPAAAAQTADATQARHAFDIPAQDLESALQAVVLAGNGKVLYRRELLEGARSSSLKGEYTTEEAVQLLLSGTNLTYEMTSTSVVLIRSKDDKFGVSLYDSGIRLAQTTADTPSRESSAASDEPAALEEILVTAQKREERLQDVPVPVAVLNTEELASTNQMRLQDYYQSVPGLGLTMAGDVGRPQVSIRGITTGGFSSSATVGTVVDGVPFGASTATLNTSFAGDLDPSDMSRIEVLRGPQGTLYGASSLGGLLNYVMAEPSVDKVSGRVQVGALGSKGSGDAGYTARLSANVPLAEDFAVRVSGSVRRNPGYIDNVQTGESDDNSLEARTGRFAMLWTPRDDFSLNFSALFQHMESSGATEVHLPHLTPAPARPDLGDLEHAVLRNAGTYDQSIEHYTLVAKQKLGAGAELTSLTGYSEFSIDSVLDVTPSLGFANGFFPNAAGLGYGPEDGDTQVTYNELKKLSQELRLTLPLGDRIDWLIAGFYTKEKYPALTEVAINDTSTGAPIGFWQTIASNGEYQEYAGFTDLTFRFTERFDVQVGARYSNLEIDSLPSVTIGMAPLLGFGSPVGVARHSEDSTTTYLFSPRFRVSSDLMLYGRYATGYRPGGFNVTTIPVSSEFEPDTSVNYELGAKGNLFDGRVTFDASVYYIDWQDLQLQVRFLDPVTNVTTSYTSNAGSAISQGVELSLGWHPIDALNLSGWIAYGDATLDKIPSNVSVDIQHGDSLPYNAEWTGYLSADYEFPLAEGLTGFAGASMSYTGDRVGRFNAFPNPPAPQVAAPRVDYPSYTLLNLTGGVRRGDWKVEAFITNLADKRAVLRQGLDANQAARMPYSVTYVQPRSYGVSVTKSF